MPPRTRFLQQTLQPFRIHLSARTLSTSSTTGPTSSIPKEPVLLVQNIPAPHSGHIRVLQLNRPEARNALSVELLGLLERQVEAVAAQGGDGPTRALVLASRVDRTFCAGADLKERRKMNKDEVESFLSQLRSTFTTLANLPIPTISAVSGTALGGGLELALCTHLRVFSSVAAVGLPETRLGIVPGAGGTYRLRTAIGDNRARDLMLTGRRVSGPEAYFIGLCDRLVEVTAEEQPDDTKAREKVLREAVSLASGICEGGPVAVKSLLWAMAEREGSQERENEAYRVVMGTEDRVEALKAFAEKRMPVFKGR